MTAVSLQRRLPVGAESQAGGGVHFRVWAPSRGKVEVVLEDLGAWHTNGHHPHANGHPAGAEPHAVELTPEGNGYHSGLVPGAHAGARYRYRLDGGPSFPDPASRFQPEGPHGPSRVVDPSAFQWTDHDWRGVSLPGQVLYELHVGTFTREGTWEAAARELPAL